MAMVHRIQLGEFYSCFVQPTVCVVRPLSQVLRQTPEIDTVNWVCKASSEKCKCSYSDNDADDADIDGTSFASC